MPPPLESEVLDGGGGVSVRGAVWQAVKSNAKSRISRRIAMDLPCLSTKSIAPIA
jgi:23S rRNA G2445 N2-methylase RlmL